MHTTMHTHIYKHIHKACVICTPPTLSYGLVACVSSRCGIPGLNLPRGLNTLFIGTAAYTLRSRTRQYKRVLTMVDAFTRWPVAVPIKDRSSASIASAIYKHWICEKGTPMKIVSDQAREFISKGMKQLAIWVHNS